MDVWVCWCRMLSLTKALLCGLALLEFCSVYVFLKGICVCNIPFPTRPLRVVLAMTRS
ncbi:hypothetical protein KSP40_PGU000048 [Platanthera guangdongensis]|uniref:Uncharacterized protein n=1 Tax=Platanthera guangdongensis TaxID=2320717 RepID=A0ABR2LJU2_9ASPA